MSSPKLSFTQKQFVFFGLLQLLAAMVIPFFWQYALVLRPLVMCHLIGVLQALLYFTFATLWGYFTFTPTMRVLTLCSTHISLISNWVGTAFSAFFATGKSQFIIPTQIASFPKIHRPTLNDITLLLINASEYIILATLLLMVALFIKKHYKYHWMLDTLFILLTILMTAFIVIQCISPQLSNSF